MMPRKTPRPDPHQTPKLPTQMYAVALHYSGVDVFHERASSPEEAEQRARAKFERGEAPMPMAYGSSGPDCVAAAATLSAVVAPLLEKGRAYER